MDLSIGGGVKSSRSKGLQNFIAEKFSYFGIGNFPSTVGRGLKIDFSKAKVRFSGEGSDLSDSVKSLVSTVEKTAGLPRSQGYLLPRNDMSRKVAFTLAEVLITLGIIGVVAALTLPTLMNKINNSEKTAKLKKFYSVMTQAYTMAEQEFGSGADWEKEAPLRDDDNKLIDQPDAALVFFKKYFAPYLKVTDMGIKDLYNNGVLENKAYVAFADGSMVYLTNGNCIDFIYDVNGASVPNKFGYDQFDFLYCNKTYSNSFFGNENRYFGTYVQKYTEQGRDYNKEICAANGIYCTTLLLIDNWEFKDDYPWK